MIEFLFLDLDDTILDFKKAEYAAISRTLEVMGAAPSEAVCRRYHQINKEHWVMLEQGRITRAQLRADRFGVLFRELGMEADGRACAEVYEDFLGEGCFFLPGAEETVKKLAEKYRLFVVSNGNTAVQAKRLTGAGLYPWFEQVFISQQIGHNKPSGAFFEACFARIPGFDREKCLMVGDSLTSDIQGGINAGLRTCWVNPEHKPWGDIRPDYEIEALAQLPELLERL